MKVHLVWGDIVDFALSFSDGLEYAQRALLNTRRKVCCRDEFDNGTVVAVIVLIFRGHFSVCAADAHFYRRAEGELKLGAQGQLVQLLSKVLLWYAQFNECGYVHIPSDTAAGLVKQCAHKLGRIRGLIGEVVG